LSAGALRAEFAPVLGMAGVSLRHEGDERTGCASRRRFGRQTPRQCRSRSAFTRTCASPAPRRHLVLDQRGIPTGTGEREVGLRRVAPGETFAATFSIVVA
jgi:hypothetical protein